MGGRENTNELGRQQGSQGIWQGPGRLWRHQPAWRSQDLRKRAVAEWQSGRVLRVRTLSQLPRAVGSPTTPGIPGPLLPPVLKAVDQSLVSKGSSVW